MAKTNGKRNRKAGHTYELEEVSLHKNHFPVIGTTRQFNRSRDADGIDICMQDEAAYGRLILDISCKSACVIPNYPKLFSKIPTGDGRIKVVLHQYTRRGGGTIKPRMDIVGRYATLERAGYEKLLECAIAINHIRHRYPEMIDRLEQLMNTTFISIPKCQMQPVGGL